MKKDDHDSIIHKLQQLPMIKDKISKDDLFLRISSQMIEEGRTKTHKRKPYIPIFGTLLVLTIFFIMLPSLLDRHHDSTRQESTTLEESSSLDEIKTSVEEKHITSLDEPAHSNAELTHVAENDYTIQSLGDDFTIIHAAVADEQLQFVIPLSLVVPKTNDLNFYYDHLNEFFVESEWGVSEYMFKNIIFDVEEGSKEVIMKFPENYSIGEGSAIPQIFEKSLSMMFTPYGFEKVVFESSDEQGIDLGPFGRVEELPLMPMEPSHYKLYKVSEEKRGFLVPIPEASKNISEALHHMQESDESFDVYQTIPSHIDFTVDLKEDHLNITFFASDDEFEQQEAHTMIEAILMTAKSFGIHNVQFENIPFQHIGPYELSGPIAVPEAVNPITQIN